MPNQVFTGIQRAAILLLSIGEHNAAEVLGFLPVEDIRRLSLQMARLPSIEKKDVDRVLDEFSPALQTQTSVGLGTQDYVRAMLEPSIGPERAEPLFDHMFVDANNSKGLDMLKWMQPKAVAELIHKEHPQIIAIILSHLDSDNEIQFFL